MQRFMSYHANREKKNENNTVRRYLGHCTVTSTIQRDELIRPQRSTATTTNLIHGDGFQFHQRGGDNVGTITQSSVLLQQTTDVDSMHVDMLSIISCVTQTDRHTDTRTKGIQYQSPGRK